MVVIRRQQRATFRTNKPQSSNGCCGGSSGGGGGRGYCSLRNIILLLVMIQGGRMYLGLLSATTTTTTTSTTGKVQSPNSIPMGIQDRLKEYVHYQSGSGGSGSGQIVPPPPPAAAAAKQQVVSSPDNHKFFENNQDHIIPNDTGEDYRNNNPNDSDPENLESEDSRNKINNKSNNNGLDQQPSFGDPIHKIVLNKKGGTGPTNVGYVKDFDYERDHPKFRLAKEKSSNGVVTVVDEDVLQMIASAAEEPAVKPCLMNQQTKELHPKCLDASNSVQIAYNAAPFPRTWCDTDIGPGSAITMHEYCSDPTVHLFQLPITTSQEQRSYPPVSGQGMTPIIIHSSHHDEHDGETGIPDDDLETIECDIPCKQEKGLSGDIRYIHGEPTWQILVPEGDSYELGNVKIERTDFRLDKYYSTQSFASSIPRPLYKSEKHSLLKNRRPAVNWETAQDKAFYLVNKACVGAGTKRGKYIDAMKRSFPVDSFGTCHHTADFPAGKDIKSLDDRLDVMKNYKIVLAFDVSSSKDHISEHVWEAFLSGAVPIVLGAENMKEHMPPNSFVWAGDHGDWDELAAYAKEVASNRTLWESYHKWRSDEEAIRQVEAKYEFTFTDPTCRLCRWAYAKKYGMGWDHGKQVVTEPKLNRQLCVSSSSSSSSSMVVTPFQEIWLSKGHDDDDFETIQNNDPSNGMTCKSLSTESTIVGASFQLQRTLVQHDGVTDIKLSNIELRNNDSGSKIILRLKIPNIRNSDGAYFPHTHTAVKIATLEQKSATMSSATIQDEFAKVTVLADWETSIESTGEGIVEVVIFNGASSSSVSFPKRIRIIMEDTTEIHDKMTEFFPSSFGTKMTRDFVDPLALFYPADS